MEITARSSFTGQCGMPIRPLLAVLLGTSAGVAAAASPGASFRLTATQQPTSAIPAPRLLPELWVNSNDIVSLALPVAPPGGRADAPKPFVSRTDSRELDAAMPGPAPRSPWPAATVAAMPEAPPSPDLDRPAAAAMLSSPRQHAETVPAPVTGPAALLPIEQEPIAGKAALAEVPEPPPIGDASVLPPGAPVALAPIAAASPDKTAAPGLRPAESLVTALPRLPDASIPALAPVAPRAAGSATGMSFVPSSGPAGEARPARLSGSRRQAMPSALAPVTSSLHRSQASRLSLTERGVAFDTAALVNGTRAGTVPLLIADGENISVRLGDILTLVEPLMEKSRYDALRSSKSASEYVTLRTLRASGIGARMDAQDQLVLGSKARYAGLAGTPAESGSERSSPTGPVAIGFYIDRLTESPDGSSIASTTSWTMLADVTVKQWKLSVDASYKFARGSTPSLAEQRRSGLTGKSGKGATYQSAGFSDMRLSAERSVPLVGKLKLDLLGRVTVPTGQRGIDRARGRYELLLDAGLSTKVGKADVWAGAGHRFRTTGFYTPGRDVTEFYTGSELAVGEKTTLRADFLTARSPFRGEAREYSLSTGLSHRLTSEVILDANVFAFRDAYGKGVQGGLTLRMPMQAF